MLSLGGADDSYVNLASIPEALIQNNLDTSTRYEEALIAKTLFALHWGRTLFAIDQDDVDAAKKVFVDAQSKMQTNEIPSIAVIAKKITQEVDKNNDGIITAEEIKAYSPGKTDGVSKWTKMADYLALDPDKDGKLTLEDLTILARKAFHTVDSDSDCFLANNELEAARFTLTAAARARMSAPDKSYQ